MSRILKDAMNRSLSGIDFDARLSDGVMRRIETAEGEAGIMKRKIAVSLVAAIALVLILAAGAVAAAYLGGAMGVVWFGNPVRWAEEEPIPTSAQTQEMTSEDWKLAEELFSGKPKDEIWDIDYDNGNGVMQGVGEEDVGLNDLKKRIREAGLPFLVPDPPEGYVFKSSWLSFFIDEQAFRNVTYLGTETPYEGMTLRRIRTGEDIKRNIDSYNIRFEDASGNQISVTAQFNSTQGTHGFGAREDDTYESVTVPGMEKALYIKRNGIDEALYLIQTGFEAIQYVGSYDIDSDYRWGENTQIYDDVLYDINSKTAPKDVLLSVANSLK